MGIPTASARVPAHRHTRTMGLPPAGVGAGPSLCAIFVLSRARVLPTVRCCCSRSPIKLAPHGIISRQRRGRLRAEHVVKGRRRGSGVLVGGSRARPCCPNAAVFPPVYFKMLPKLFISGIDLLKCICALRISVRVILQCLFSIRLL